MLGLKQYKDTQIVLLTISHISITVSVRKISSLTMLSSWHNQNNRTLTNGHLSTTATFFVPANSPYIDSCLNLSTTTTATIARLNCQKNLSTTATASFFSEWRMKSGMAIKFDPWRVDDRGYRFDCVSFNIVAVSINCLQ